MFMFFEQLFASSLRGWCGDELCPCLLLWISHEYFTQRIGKYCYKSFGPDIAWVAYKLLMSSYFIRGYGSVKKLQFLDLLSIENEKSVKLSSMYRIIQQVASAVKTASVG